MSFFCFFLMFYIFFRVLNTPLICDLKKHFNKADLGLKWVKKEKIVIYLRFLSLDLERLLFLKKDMGI